VNEFNKPTNPQAFPNPHLRDDSGITMRDYFAARAMQAITKRVDGDHFFTSTQAYKLADAMLKAREE
jgi:surfactin synthase thioesterase subunit